MPSVSSVVNAALVMHLYVEPMDVVVVEVDGPERGTNLGDDDRRGGAAALVLREERAEVDVDGMPEPVAPPPVAAAPAAEPAEAPPPGQTALFNSWEDAVECARCGGRMVRTGSCYTCRDCGTNTGCS